MTVLELKAFAQIDEARVEFGDLTVLVGPQASGKSLLLQWLKFAIDIGEVVFALKEAGHDVKTEENLLDLTFGEGMSGAWKEGTTEVRFNGNSISPHAWIRGLKRKDQGNVFFIPAHRALLLAEGWPAPFLKLNADTPVVARLFSQNLYQRFSGRQAAPLFPVQRILKEQYRNLIDDAVFHGGKVELEKEGLRYRLRLAFGELALPFMTWTAGQREFTPLLLGLYHVLRPRKVKKRKDIDWVVIEEPEMGLHPQAVAVVMLVILDLLWRGYKVVISTHSPLVLDIVWAIRRLHEHSARWRLLTRAFGAKDTPSMRTVMEHAIGSDYRVYFLRIDQKTRRVTTRDISQLDPDSADDNEATWGGLTGFSSRFGEAVRSATNEDSPLMARQTHLKEALKETSRLRGLVQARMGAFVKVHVKLIAENQRSRIGDSLDLDCAARAEHPESNRWDYIISIPELNELAGIEPHSAKDSEISVVISKKTQATTYLRNHLENGYRITKWFWVSPGTVSFSRMDRAHRRLDQNVIEFVGRVLRTLG